MLDGSLHADAGTAPRRLATAAITTARIETAAINTARTAVTRTASANPHAPSSSRRPLPDAEPTSRRRRARSRERGAATDSDRSRGAPALATALGAAKTAVSLARSAPLARAPPPLSAGEAEGARRMTAHELQFLTLRSELAVLEEHVGAAERYAVAVDDELQQWKAARKRDADDVTALRDQLTAANARAAAAVAEAQAAVAAEAALREQIAAERKEREAAVAAAHAAMLQAQEHETKISHDLVERTRLWRREVVDHMAKGYSRRLDPVIWHTNAPIFEKLLTMIDAETARAAEREATLARLRAGEAAADEGLAAKELAACRAQLKEARAVGARVEGVVRDGLARSVKEELAKQKLLNDTKEKALRAADVGRRELRDRNEASLVQLRDELGASLKATEARLEAVLGGDAMRAMERELEALRLRCDALEARPAPRRSSQPPVGARDGEEHEQQEAPPPPPAEDGADESGAEVAAASPAPPAATTAVVVAASPPPRPKVFGEKEWAERYAPRFMQEVVCLAREIAKCEAEFAPVREAAAATAAALEAVKRESAVRSADLADLRDRVGETEEARERMAAAAAAEAAERAAREDELRRAESRGADLLVELQHEKLRSEQAGKRLAGAERRADDQQAALAKMETRLHKAVGSLAAKAIWRWQNAVILRCWHAWRERTRGRAALNGLLELQPPVLDAAVPVRARPPAKGGRRRSVTNPLLDAKRDEAAYQI